MSTNFTNRKASQSLRGQAVIVSLNAADSFNLYLLAKGQVATNSSSGKTGTVGHIDVYGHSFQVVPIQPNTDFSSATTYGYLASGETVGVAT